MPSSFTISHGWESRKITDFQSHSEIPKNLRLWESGRRISLRPFILDPNSKRLGVRSCTLETPVSGDLDIIHGRLVVTRWLRSLDGVSFLGCRQSGSGLLWPSIIRIGPGILVMMSPRVITIERRKAWLGDRIETQDDLGMDSKRSQRWSPRQQRCTTERERAKPSLFWVAILGECCLERDDGAFQSKHSELYRYLGYRLRAMVRKVLWVLAKYFVCQGTTLWFDNCDSTWDLQDRILGQIEKLTKMTSVLTKKTTESHAL